MPTEADPGQKSPRSPAAPATQGETLEELLTDLCEAIEGCLSVDATHVKTGAHDRVTDIAI